MKSNFKLMAEYNKWINESIYSAASHLSRDSLSENKGAFFGSIIGTLNHILVADVIWLKRFASHPSNFSSLHSLAMTPLPENLDSILFSDFAKLKNERNRLDDVILEFVNQLSDELLDSDLSYQNSNGVPFKKPFSHLIQHFFNHQTHHRGQISTLLFQSGIDLGVTDLLAKIPNAYEV
nr:DinB family protein [Alteromonas macleodii]